MDLKTRPDLGASWKCCLAVLAAAVRPADQRHASSSTRQQHTERSENLRGDGRSRSTTSSTRNTPGDGPNHQVGRVMRMAITHPKDRVNPGDTQCSAPVTLL
eukprot:gnl/MRDRNA2_/MRDRNA2_206793_c0_seq1.p2 gnl/MRDRNA2_/MRDRNA2_206793_c0~~gnl/MRDRNA2_/MRDRNA2_206793_c0_seq1.p2  ORF type:complete len:102 (+),score=4.58 gnl/MRDRNA2_/MRDRNA2_206793_c0_seq1:158-463(+)